MAEAYASATATLLKMAGQEDTAAARALAAGAQRIDEAFATGGYTTPIDTSAISEPAKTRLDMQLAYANLAIAAWVLSSPVDAKQGTPSKVKKDYDEIMKWLNMIATRQIVLVALGGSSSSGISVIGDELWGFTNEMFNLAHASEIQG